MSIVAAALLAALGGLNPGSPLRAEDAAALQQEGAGAAFPAGQRWPTARVVAPVRLHTAPGGRAVARLRPRTAFGSRSVLSVVRRRAGWLQVATPERPGPRHGWIRAARVRLASTPVSVHVDRSRRTVSVRRGGRLTRRVSVSVGGRATPTPTGRFAVTDRLRLGSSPAYGCCAIALTGRQRRLVAGWRGGDRLAIHGTRQPWTIGEAASLGCLRARDRDMRALMHQVPLGAPVFITR
jgi:lipoprotein-anchoring transpeptidase ErfK/SrfK